MLYKEKEIAEIKDTLDFIAIHFCVIVILIIVAKFAGNWERGVGSKEWKEISTELQKIQGAELVEINFKKNVAGVEIKETDRNKMGEIICSVLQKEEERGSDMTGFLIPDITGMETPVLVIGRPMTKEEKKDLSKKIDSLVYSKDQRIVWDYS